MNFGWINPGNLAGCQGPVRQEDLLYLKRQGIGALVRMEERTISGAEAGLDDLGEYVPDSMPPSFEQMDRIVAFIDEQVRQGHPVAVS